MEPFDTFRTAPRRFAVGLPVVFIGSLAAAVAVLEFSFSLALAVLLVLQTGGFAALYLPALRRRRPGPSEATEGRSGSAVQDPEKPANP